MNPVILGDGILGTEVNKQTGWPIISRLKDGIDFVKGDYFELISEYDTVINCIAFTKTYSDSKEDNWNVNLIGLDKLIDYCNSTSKKLVHVSTDYIYTGSDSFASEESVPVHINTWYGYTKLVGDALVQLRSKDYLVCRLSHKKYPFEFDSAWDDILTNCDYIDVIADLFIQLINKNASGVFNVGTNVKTIYDLAKKSRKDVKPTNRIKLAPKDISMNISKLSKFLSIK